MASIKGGNPIFVASVDSGGTLQDVGKFLKEHYLVIHIATIELEISSVLLGHEPRFHQIQGAGDGFVPDILYRNILDEVIEVSEEETIETTHKFQCDYGLLVGISSGTNVWASRQLSEMISCPVATVLPYRSKRYFSNAHDTDKTLTILYSMIFLILKCL